MNAIPDAPSIVADEPAAARAAPPPGRADSTLSVERPFPGLRPFGFADREFFFGREQQVFALYRLIEHGRFVAVIGSSGSGKSSLVLAGLCKLLLEESEDSSGPNWVCLDMRPGAAPLSRLAASLARLATGDNANEAGRRRDRIEYRLRQSSFSLEEALGEAGGLGDRTLLLIVDQFEELFRFGLAAIGPRRGGLDETRAREEATQFVQILLDADRRRLEHVHVLITMRSDFIGDCAYFQGLSEAVSATQYLVPNLTRRQLEDAIRKPIDKAGGTIEPELVERLINDCGDELDQLPVLQHCLMRLWDRASSIDGPRRLTRQTYDDIGRMAEALSRHADEVLRECAGKETAVEQAFRALAELDREGRAIRRALRFGKLVAETGFREADVRDVLDKFRAPNCSFLVPPPSIAPTLADDDRVDIGHETLLRRWKKIAGEPASGDPKAGRPAKGWLREEEDDGRWYRLLASLLDGDAGGEKATLKNPGDTKRRWDKLPRTAAWAERYGGNFDRVKALVLESLETQARKRTVKFGLIGAAALTAAAVAFIVIVEQWKVDQATQKQQQLAQQELQLEKGQVQAVMGLLHDIIAAKDHGRIQQGSAKAVVDISENFARNILSSMSNRTIGDEMWIQYLNVETDIAANFEDQHQALQLAQESEKIVEPLISAAPNDPDLLELAFQSAVRVGDALVDSPNEAKNFDSALMEYRKALGFANSLAGIDQSKKSEDHVIVSHFKIGDVYNDRSNREKALGEYREALAICKSMLEKAPDELQWLRQRGAANYRMAVVYQAARQWDDAEGAFRAAETDQEAVLAKSPDDPSKKSNLAATHTRMGDLARDKGDLHAALLQYQQGVAMQEQLVRDDSTNPIWEAYLAPSYLRIARVLKSTNQPDQALEYFRKNYDARLDLARKDTSNYGWQRSLAYSARALGENFTGEAKLERYREALKIWKTLAENEKSKNYALSLYNDMIKLAEAFLAERDGPDAASAYGAAETIAQLNEADEHSKGNGSWQEKADQAAKSAAAAAALGSQSSPAPN